MNDISAAVDCERAASVSPPNGRGHRRPWPEQRSSPSSPSAVLGHPLPLSTTSDQPTPVRTSPTARSASGRFSHDSAIQLGGGRWKRVEQLSEEDFAASAALRCDAQLDHMTVTHVLHNHDRDTVSIGFQLTSHRTHVRPNYRRSLMNAQVFHFRPKSSLVRKKKGQQSRSAPPPKI